jgi:hypothetical protein
MNKFLGLIMFLLFVSCNSDKSTPEGALKSFVELNFSGSASREEILGNITGKMKESFEGLSEEDFKKSTQFKELEKQGFKVVSKNCEEKQCYITYSLAFKNKESAGTLGFKTEVKKIAELKFDNGKWLIADVSNVKTYLEALDTIQP